MFHWITLTGWQKILNNRINQKKIGNVFFFQSCKNKQSYCWFDLIFINFFQRRERLMHRRYPSICEYLFWCELVSDCLVRVLVCITSFLSQRAATWREELTLIMQALLQKLSSRIEAVAISGHVCSTIHKLLRVVYVFFILTFFCRFLRL